MTKSTTLRRSRYRGGKTIDVASDSQNQTGEISVLETRKLLGITNRITINKHLKALGLYGRDFLTWNEVEEVYKLYCFLGLKPGYNSRKMYLFLVQKGVINQVFSRYQINPTEQFKRLKNDYCNQR